MFHIERIRSLKLIIIEQGKICFHFPESVRLMLPENDLVASNDTARLTGSKRPLTKATKPTIQQRDWDLEKGRTKSLVEFEWAQEKRFAETNKKEKMKRVRESGLIVSLRPIKSEA